MDKVQHLQEFCKRGHSLSGSNLNVAALKRGERVCIKCQRFRNRRWYKKWYYGDIEEARRITRLKVREHRKTDVYKRTVIRRKDKTAKFLIDYKRQKGCQCKKKSCWHKGPCIVTDPRVIEFDHKKPRKKEFNIAFMVSNKYSLKAIIKEIEKCNTICRNCHVVRYNRIRMKE